MTKEQFYKNLDVPTGKIDAVLDTDTYNEIDDQFALSYMLCSTDKISVKGIYAAPFFNSNSTSPEDGMNKSYDEIIKLLELMDKKDFSNMVFKGSATYLPDEKTPVVSDAANNLVSLAQKYSPENPLYVVAIGAITNIASALLIAPEIRENIVIVWLGGHSFDYHDTSEFNMRQDIAAARVVFSSKAPVIQLPCVGVVSGFYVTGPELKFWLLGKNKLCDYLAQNTIGAAECYAAGKPWSRVIWDVTAVAWLLNDNERFIMSRVEKIRMPEYDFTYNETPIDAVYRYAYYINRDVLMEDLIKKLTAF